MTKQYDLVIIGAGIAGRSLACAAADQGLQVALLDKQALSSAISPELDLRMSAINAKSRQFFERLKVWSAIRDQRCSPFTKMHVWDGEGSICFDSQATNSQQLGFIIENQVMSACLAEKILQHQAIDFYTEQALSVYVFEDSVQLLLAGQVQLQAKLLVGADGANSWLRKETGIEINSKSYQQVATVAVIKTEKPHQQTAWQHFTPQGPVAFLPLEDPNLCSIVWSQGVFRAKKLERMDDEQFIVELEKDFQQRLGKMTLVSARKSFPLTMRHAKSYISQRVALLGDAIHTIHPLAGLGLNLGLSDVACLADLLAEAVADNQDIGAAKLLARYQRTRRLENLTVLAAMRFFKELFSNDNDVLRILRNSGLNWVDGFGCLKNFLFDSANDLPAESSLMQ